MLLKLFSSKFLLPFSLLGYVVDPWPGVFSHKPHVIMGTGR